MTGSNTHLRLDPSVSPVLLYLCASQGQSLERFCLPRPVLDSRPTWRQRLSLAGLLRVTILGIGLAYAVTSLLGEYHYAKALRQSQVGSAIDELRSAKTWFPLNHTFRTASAIALGGIALKSEQEPRWRDVALPELLSALHDDPTSAELLAPLITIELAMGRDEQARAHYGMFKAVAKSSPLNEIVGK